MMHMTIYWGKDVTILFDWWRTDSWLTYSLTLLACFLVSASYQFLEDLRIRFKSSDRSSNPSSIGTGTPLLSKLGKARGPRKVSAAVLFGINAAIGYLLMLAIMSFNGGVLLAVVLGLSVGFYLFRTTGGDAKEDQIDALVVENSCACA